MDTFYSSERNAQILIALLKDHGIKKIIASPGTTNIAFVASVQQDSYFEMYSSVDERSAAYMACGMAAESGEPVVLTCTGATASRNYIPGLTEAFYRKLPVLAVTSTPHTGRIGQNLPQIMDRSQQMKDIVKISIQLPNIHTDEDVLFYSVKINTALLELKRHSGGPVHINLTTSFNMDFSVRNLPTVKTIHRFENDDVLPLIGFGKRIAIVVGAHKVWSQELANLVDEFCECYNGAVFCDQTSNYNGKYRIFFSLPGNQERYYSFQRPDIMIYIGDISGAYFPLSSPEVWRVNPDGEVRAVYETLRYVFEMSELTFFKRYVDNFKQNNALSFGNTPFYDECKSVYDRLLKNIPELPFSNVWIAKQTCSQLPEGSVLHLGILNSLRSWNFFEPPKSVQGYSNTGGFGIDGCVSSLIGASLVSPDKLFFGVVGDLAFFYDMNSIGNRHIQSNIRLIIVNNAGGTEFRNYSNVFAMQIKDKINDFVAAAGHFGNQSKKLLKHYGEDLGFEYMSASSKDEYLKKVNKFISNEKLSKPILFEIFTNSKDESDALYLIQHIEKQEQRRQLTFPKPPIFCGTKDFIKPVCKMFNLNEENYIILEDEHNSISLDRLLALFNQNVFPLFFTNIYDQMKPHLESRGLVDGKDFMDGRKLITQLPPTTSKISKLPLKKTLIDEYPRLGFGVMRMPFLPNGQLDVQESERMIDEYMKSDFCYFDMHPDYIQGLSQKIVKTFVVDRYPRESFLIANKMPYYVKSKKDYNEIFASELSKCSVEYFDYYLLHCLNKTNYKLHESFGGFQFIAQMKREGKIKHIGFSFHDKPELLEKILQQHPEIEFVQLQINYLDWEDPIIQSKKLYDIAKKYDKKIFVMEPIKGGSLAKLSDLDLGFPTDQSSLAALALKFVASLDVNVILSGMSSLTHVIDNRKTFIWRSPLSIDDLKKYDILRDTFKKIIQIPCTSCRYCERECPKHVAIPDIMGILNFCEYKGVAHKEFLNPYNRFKLFYDSHILPKGKASNCIKCGKCELRCPQKIQIRKHLQNAKIMFEG